MATPTSIRPYSKRFLGNSRRTSLEVHDLQAETTSCQINEIVRAGNAVTFLPDTQAQANREGYDNCYYCLGGSKR